MEVANSMRNLTEQMLASYNVRVKALGDLVSDTRKTLEDFAEERKNMGHGQSKHLFDFANALSANVDDMLKGYHKNRKTMSDKQTRYLEGFTSDLVKNTTNTLNRLLKGRRQMSNEQEKNLTGFTASLTRNVKAILKGFYKDHRRMSDEQAKNLGDFVNNLARDTNTMMNGFKKTHGEMSAELKGELAASMTGIRTYTRDKLKEFEKAHGRMSDSLKKSLTKYVNDLSKDVSRLLHGYEADMKKAGQSWDRMSSTLSGARMKTIAPSIEAGEKISTVREAIGKKKPDQKQTTRESKVEGRVLEYINKHPEGVKIVNMEMAFGLPGMKLGTKTQDLLEKGRIRKEANLYYPLVHVFQSQAVRARVHSSGSSKRAH